MARPGTGSLLSRRDARLDSFLQRNMARAVYERVRASEPCVVISDSVNKAYMHAVIGSERVYLTEHAPRTLTTAVHFRRVRDIALVNDLPEFLSGKEQQRCQHIRIVYVTDTRTNHRARRDQGAGPPLPAPPPRRSSHCPAITHNRGGHPAERLHRDWTTAEAHRFKPGRSASCPDPETLGLLGARPRPPPLDRLDPPALDPPASITSPPAVPRVQGPRRIGWVLSRLLRKEHGGGGGQREAELHLYAVSRTSRLYLQLQRSWSSFVIRSTLMLDPLYRRKCCSSSDSSPGKQLPAVSWERTAQLLAQLTSELLQAGLGLEALYQLLQELHVAAHRSLALRRLFWRSGELCVFLVQTLEASLQSGGLSADHLLLSTLVVETLAAMFSETQGEAARTNLLAARNGALSSRILAALICDPIAADADAQIQELMCQYLDASCWLLFELLLLGHESSRWVSADDLLSADWLLRVMQPHPHLLAFMTRQAQQVVLVLSGQQERALGPVQAVALFRRCRLLLACLRRCGPLHRHLRSNMREEFRYLVKTRRLEEKLPPHYPISSQALGEAELLLLVLLH